MLLIILPVSLFYYQKYGKKREGTILFSSEKYFQGKMAFDSKDYKTALRLWAESAAQGYPDAQGLIGGMYAGGLGVKKDFKM